MTDEKNPVHVKQQMKKSKKEVEEEKSMPYKILTKVYDRYLS